MNQPPTNPFARYSNMQQPDDAETRRKQMAMQMQQLIMAQPAQTAAQGFGQLATGIGMGLSKYQDKGEAFPIAPGGAAPSAMTGLANFFTRRNNGGLY
jgi:hypothetical protein